MDDILDMINSLLKAFDEWKTAKDLDEAYALERKLDNLRLMMGYRFDDLRSLARAARELDRYISYYETQQDLTESISCTDGLMASSLEEVFTEAPQ